MREKGLRANLVGLTWVSPWIVGALAFLALPIGLSLYYSFTDYPILEPPIFTGLDNYERLLHDRTFHITLRNTLVFAALSIPITTVVSILVAVLLDQKVKAAGFFQSAVFLPTLVPLVASSMIWMWLLNAGHGMINRALRFLGLPAPNWLTDPDWVMPTLVMISLWSIGQAVVLYLAALRDVPRQLYEAADIDGMGPGRKLLYVTLPQISPVVLFNVIVLTIATFQIFVIPYVLYRQKDGQMEAAYFYTVYLYDNAFIYGQMGYASAMAWVQLVIILALTGLTFLVSKKLVYYRAG